MLIKMLQTTPGSINGRRTSLYIEGKTYDLPYKLAALFVTDGKAEELGGVKMIKSPYEDKMIKSPHEDKKGGTQDGKGQGQKERSQEAEGQGRQEKVGSRK